MRSIIALLCTLPIAVAAQTAPPPPLVALGRDVLAELIGINTVQPGGNVTRASERVAARFRAAGFAPNDVLVIGANPTTRNVIVRWRARRPSTRKPILLLAHLDVVAAPRDGWNTDPFRLTERDGWLYGRGTLDTKGGAAQFIASLLYLKRSGWTPSRDIVLALTAGEESGIDNGVEWLVKHRRDLVDVAWVWNADGGGGASRGGRRVAFDVELAEKVYQSYTLTARNPGGHSSTPSPDNAIYRLAAALGRLSAFTFPAHVTPVTQAWLGSMAAIEGGSRGARMAQLAAHPSDSAAAAELSAGDTYLNAQLHTTCVATMLSGGHADNALPQRAEATVNCRLIPGESVDSVRATLQRVVADTGVAVALGLSGGPSPATPLDSALFAAIGRAVRVAWEPLPVIPFMDTGASDGLYLRQLGIPTFVFWPLFDLDPETRAHGANERISADEFARGLWFTVTLLKEVPQF